MAIFPSSAIPSASGGYTIDQSLRFNDDDSAYLSWTPASAGNRLKWSMSFWVKRGNLGTTQEIFRMHDDGNNHDPIYFDTNNKLQWNQFHGGAWYSGLDTNRVFRDVGSWYHILLVFDSAQATSTNRQKMYINGVEETSFSYSLYPSQSTTSLTNKAGLHHWGANHLGASELDGYLAEVNFIDGTAELPSAFGESGDYGEWKPKKYSGTYGTNGFYLDFSNSGSLGTDASSNSNNWTPSNLASTDQMVDSPTNNFATLNPLYWNPTRSNTGTYSEGNLKESNVEDCMVESTIAATTGKWYFEARTLGDNMFGWGATNKWGGDGPGYQDSLAVHSNGKFIANGSYTGVNVNTGLAFNSGTHTIMMAVDLDNQQMWFGRNGTWYVDPASAAGVSFSSYATLGDSMVVAARASNGSSSQYSHFNFGQDSSFAGALTAQGNQDSNEIGDFYYTPPSGFLALCTSNLPDPAVIPSEHFNTVLYTAATSNGTYQITGNGFQPDFSWVKNRDNVERHLLFDSVRGNTSMTDKFLVADQTSAEGTNGVSGTTVTVNTDGMQIVETTIGSGELYFNGRTYVMWNWNCPTTFTPTVTSGLTSASGRSNADAGFSIVKVTADSNISNSSSYTHNLGAVPEMIITKITSGTGGWNTYHKDLGGAGKYIELNTTTAVQDATNVFETTPTSTIVKPGSNIIANGQTLIFYNFASVDGYSKVGSYTGNANADGTFIYTGFRPKFVMIKGADIAQNWFIHDSERSPYNEIDGETLRPDLSNAEASNTAGNQDFLSNGFKLRMTDDNYNGSGNTYIYLAFAETPFKYSNAR